MGASAPAALWYGLTRGEAESRCEREGLLPRFSLTLAPNAASPAHPTDEQPSRTRAEAPATLKVIRAREEAGVVDILLGRFADGSADISPGMQGLGDKVADA